LGSKIIHRQGLGQAGHALEQDVPAGEKPDQEALHHHLLPDDPFADLLHHGLHGSGIHGPGGQRGASSHGIGG
jgi:hypothetical protein